MLSPRTCVAVVAMLAATAAADSIKDIKHIVLFMQENRAFDHYFGTMAGVRNFADPNVQVNPDGNTTFEQLVASTESTAAPILKPWYLNYQGGVYFNATRCMAAGSNAWSAMQGAYNGGLVNNWVIKNTPYNWGHFTRNEVPTHFDIAEGWTVLDMNTESILAATSPNRVFWMSNTVNAEGTPSNADGSGSIIIDDTTTPGCEKANLNCFPFTWKTIPEYIEAAGISWQVYQDYDNFEDNPLAYFEQYQNAANTSAIKTKGDSYNHPLSEFYERAANGTLPQISWIIGPAELSEHYPYLPSDGAWLQKKVVDSVVQGAAYKNTALIITYDEVGGWGDHVVPIVPPNNTAGEWITDPSSGYGWVPIGPGYRVPMYIISPWTRGGNVFVEHADHTSHNLFLENWATAHGYSGVLSEELPPWRRGHMSTLLNAFDFANPDYSIPSVTQPDTPLTDGDVEEVESVGSLGLGANSGPYTGAAKCESDNSKNRQPTVPYGEANMNQNLTTLPEDGFKPVRGGLTEGRFLVFESQGRALANLGGGVVGTSAATADHRDIRQRWILHLQVEANTLKSSQFTAAGIPFKLQSALDGSYVSTSHGKLTSKAADAEVFAIVYRADSVKYTLSVGTSAASCSKPFLGLVADKNKVNWTSKQSGGLFSVFSVNYK